MIELSAEQARSIAVAAQGLHTADSPRHPTDILRHLGCIQLDTINVIRRSHELVQLARGATPEDARHLIDESAPPILFEYWAHAASLVPLALWPLFAFRRRAFATKGWRGPTVDSKAVDHVRTVIADQETVTISDLGGAQGSGWERSSANKWALEWLLATGELVCVHRRSWQRVYQAAQSVLPDHLLSNALTDDECLRALTRLAIEALGIGTAGDVADYFRLPPRAVTSFLRELDNAEECHVEGWREPTWVANSAMDGPQPNQEACTPLSPFDSLVWHRPRMKRLFGVEYLLEAYKPAARRECGYFGMPVLVGTALAGRIAARVSKGTATLEGHQLLDGHDPACLDSALATVCRWAEATHTLSISRPNLHTGATT